MRVIGNKSSLKMMFLLNVLFLLSCIKEIYCFSGRLFFGERIDSFDINLSGVDFSTAMTLNISILDEIKEIINKSIGCDQTKKNRCKIESLRIDKIEKDTARPVLNLSFDCLQGIMNLINSDLEKTSTWRQDIEILIQKQPGLNNLRIPPLNMIGIGIDLYGDKDNTSPPKKDYSIPFCTRVLDQLVKTISNDYSLHGDVYSFYIDKPEHSIACIASYPTSNKLKDTLDSIKNSQLNLFPWNKKPLNPAQLKMQPSLQIENVGSSFLYMPLYEQIKESQVSSAYTYYLSLLTTSLILLPSIYIYIL